jgi:hypothetical protein
MGKRVFLLLGNGITIDFLDFASKNGLNPPIDVFNLFAQGDSVPWPGSSRAGFLSPKYCRNLWTLGARPNIEYSSSLSIIEDILTCANVGHTSRNRKDKTYINAYIEFVYYIKALFTFYNQKIDPKSLKINDWPWFKYLNSLYNNENIESIHVITFNYDIWLERVLNQNNIKFKIAGFENGNEGKITIYKPHGSISFSQKGIQTDPAAFNINYDIDYADVDISKFEHSIENISLLGSINAIIPPAGDPSRLGFKWAHSIREEIAIACSNSDKESELIVAGLSYWHVDRLEIDQILTKICSDLDEVRVINPNPPNALAAVMSTIFDNVVFHKSANSLFP